jgi:hypothetical protein
VEPEFLVVEVRGPGFLAERVRASMAAAGAPVFFHPLYNDRHWSPPECFCNARLFCNAGQFVIVSTPLAVGATPKVRTAPDAEPWRVMQ